MSRRQLSASGFTLVELMVSITIALILLTIVSAVYLSSRSSYRLGDENAKLQENMRSTMAKLGRHITQVGYQVPIIYMQRPLLDGSSVKTEVSGKDQTSTPFFVACDMGFADPASDNDACANTAGFPAFWTRYEADSPDLNTGAGLDCNGRAVSPRATPNGNIYEVKNYFYLAIPSGETSPALYCVGNGGGTPQIMLRNVEDMRLTYGINNGGNVATANHFESTAAATKALTSDFKNLVSLAVCLEVKSGNPGTTKSQAYVGCNQANKTNSDGRIHAVLTSTFALRNFAETSNLTYP